MKDMISGPATAAPNTYPWSKERKGCAEREEQQNNGCSLLLPWEGCLFLVTGSIPAFRAGMNCPLARFQLGAQEY
mgnify:FL=1